MSLKTKLLAISVSLPILFAGVLPANAFVSALILADRMVEKSQKEALATPGHIEWCQRKYPGFRPQWNNYKLENGRVAYCASPYYTPPWMAWQKK